MTKNGARTGDLLERVRKELGNRNVSQVSRDVDMPLRTVMRIKLERNIDPSYSRVRRLAEYLFG